MISISRSIKRPLTLLAIALTTFLSYTFFFAQWQPTVLDLGGVSYKVPSFDWARLNLQYPQTNLRQLPTGEPVNLPKFQHEFEGDGVKDAAYTKDIEGKKQAILHAFRKSWSAYKKTAWTWDELKPVSGGGKNTFGGFAASLVDALDTLWIMDMREEFDEAVEMVALIDWNNTTLTSVNMFETTIRHLGGLLAAYDLSGNKILLSKAIELGEMLYFGFDTPNHMPPFWFDFGLARSGRLRPSNHDPSTSGGSLSMEFTRLSQITGNPKWYDATERVKEFLRDTQSETKIPGIWPAFLDFRGLTARDAMFTIGAQADSVYEYLPKMHALLGGLDPEYAKMAELALDTISSNLLFRPFIPDKVDVLFPGDAFARSASTDHTAEMQHLSCFAGGMYALGSRLLARPDYLDTAAQLTRGCTWAYSSFPTGIMPEISTLVSCATRSDPPAEDLKAPCEWSEDEWDHIRGTRLIWPKGFRDVRDTKYILRPEAIESVFYMWRATGDEEWRESAWRMWEAITKATETELAYSAITDVNTAEGKETRKADSMESFWFSETLKYFYLIFAEPELLSLDDWVLNTEAHCFKRPKPAVADAQAGQPEVVIGGQDEAGSEEVKVKV